MPERESRTSLKAALQEQEAYEHSVSDLTKKLAQAQQRLGSLDKTGKNGSNEHTARQLQVCVLLVMNMILDMELLVSRVYVVISSACFA
jgi:hypothetical protein